MNKQNESKFLYLDTSHITNNKYEEYQYTHDERKIRVTHEPNDLFVKYTITKVGDIETIVYKVDGELKKFTDFTNKLNGNKIEEILVYFIQYNENPLYLSIFLKDNGFLNKNNIGERRINYKLDKNGDWQPATHYAYIFNDLRELAYKHDMFQYFEIENTEKDCPKRSISNSCPILVYMGDQNGDYKIYKHRSKSEVPITSLFLYRKKLLKNIIVTDKKVSEVCVYYHKDDNNNRLPLLIIIHKEEDETEYYVNEGGNYRWKKDETIKNLTNYNYGISPKLEEMKNKLMGEIVLLDIEDYYDGLYETQTEFNGINVFIQEHRELGYRSIKYSFKNKRFSISELQFEGKTIKFPELPIYSVLEFYVFHHGSGTYPMFLCAVYERTNDKIFVWYQLTKGNECKYEICYFLSEDPMHFEKLKPLIKLVETQIYILNIDINKSIADSYNEGRKKLTNIDNHNFYVWYQRSHSRHNRYVITPAFSNYFTISSLLAYGTDLNKKFDSVKEIHVFEHYNMHHYKVCIITAKYNYELEIDDITLNWLEIRKNTNKGAKWQIVGEPNITKSPDEFNDEYNISALMDERVSYYDGGKDVYYVKPTAVNEAPGLNLPYNIYPQVEYKKGDKWPPITPIEFSGSGTVYTTVEFNPDTKIIRGTTENLPGKVGGVTPLVGGLIGSGAGVGIVTVTTGYVLYSNMGTISTALGGLFH